MPDSVRAESSILRPLDRRGLHAVDATGGGCVPDTPPLVSIVIPCYNSAPYLAETIESAIGQTHPRIEVIVVDDGSTDGTASIAHSYPVIYLYQANRGISAARNAGILHSRGTYVLFLDHDDRLLPGAVQAGVTVLEARPECAVAVGEHRYIAADGTRLGQSRKCSAGRDHYLMLLVHNFIETPCSALYRRSAFAVTGVFDESVLGAEDYELFLRTARHSAFVGHDAVVAEYRLHGSNTSRDAELMLTVSYRVMQMERPYLQGNPAKLRAYRLGVGFLQRKFGRQLTLELIRGGGPARTENWRKFKLLLRHYPVGFAAVALTLLLPLRLRRSVIGLREHLVGRGQLSREHRYGT